MLNHFSFFVHGEDFDVDEYLKVATIAPFKVWRRGEQRQHSCIESLHPTSGVEYELGNGLQLPIHEQDKIAVEFLSANESEIQRLVSVPGAAYCILGLHYHTELESNTKGWVMGPSELLMWHCLNCKVKLNFYVSLHRKGIECES